jgi:uncharacterized membrane protein YbhN (UPF0104 family)
VRWRDVYGAYVAGVGVNALLPARSGDLVKLYIAKHRIEGATYTTLASSIVALTVFDMLFASALLLWALSIGVLPDLDVLPRLPTFDFTWLFDHPTFTLILLAALAVVGTMAGIWAARRIAAFRRRVAQGFAVFRDRRAYLRRVALFQAIDWGLRLLAISLFLRAFGIPASFHNSLLVQVTQSLSTIFPFSPGGIGTEQALVLYVLAGEAARSSLLAFSVGMKVTIIIVNAAVGFAAIAIMLRTVSWRRVLERAQEARGARVATDQDSV